MPDRRLPPFAETGTYGCPTCGSPSIRFRDVRFTATHLEIVGECAVEAGLLADAHYFIVSLAVKYGGIEVSAQPITQRDLVRMSPPAGTFVQQQPYAQRAVPQNDDSLLDLLQRSIDAEEAKRGRSSMGDLLRNWGPLTKPTKKFEVEP